VPLTLKINIAINFGNTAKIEVPRDRIIYKFCLTIISISTAYGLVISKQGDRLVLIFDG